MGNLYRRVEFSGTELVDFVGVESEGWFSSYRPCPTAGFVEVDEAAQRLYDAALDLLAVCEAILRRDTIAAHREQLRQAIAKAKGE